MDEASRNGSEANTAPPAPAAENDQDARVQVALGGRFYRLRAPDPALLERLAERVNRAFEGVSPAGGPRDDIKASLLAALNIAAEADAQLGETRRLIGLRVREARIRAQELAGWLAELAPPGAPSDLGARDH